jgi:putative glycerol-1-phosphate prenyltransferase
MLGLKYIYLEAGSGAKKSVNSEMIEAVKENISIPLIVGGGLNTEIDIQKAIGAGADIIVVGTSIEKDPIKLAKLVNACHSKNPF